MDILGFRSAVAENGPIINIDRTRTGNAYVINEQEHPALFKREPGLTASIHVFILDESGKPRRQFDTLILQKATR
jgi:hypothetical protein